MNKEHHTKLPETSQILQRVCCLFLTPRRSLLLQCCALTSVWAGLTLPAAVTGTMNVTSATHSPHPGRYDHPTEARMVLQQVLIFSVNSDRKKEKPLRFIFDGGVGNLGKSRDRKVHCWVHSTLPAHPAPAAPSDLNSDFGGQEWEKNSQWRWEMTHLGQG